MDYAVTLEFDKETENKIQDMIDEVARVTGCYRYDTRFAIPIYNENDELMRYNVFWARMLVRCDNDGRKYLYDFVRTKKEGTCNPFE